MCALTSLRHTLPVQRIEHEQKYVTDVNQSYGRELPMSSLTIPDNLQSVLDGRLSAAVDLALLAGRSTLEHFQRDTFTVERA